MKKSLLIFLLALICMAGSPQRFEVVTSDPAVPFKRHFSYSIEKGYVDGLSRQVVAGNQTDWLINSKVVKGNSINNNTFLSGRAVEMIDVADNILMTDFVIAPENANSEYAAGTGIYFPLGPNGLGYVFLGIYERRTGQLSNLVYFDLLYSGDVLGNTVGTRIKYAANEQAYYISGIMVDRPFVTMDINNLECHSKAFIMKILPPYTDASVLVFEPDQLQDPKLAWLCSINDIQLNDAQSSIAFTGVNTKAEFTGYYQPMVGMIDMNLNLQWCYVYELTGLRYSGIDVEFGSDDQSVFALFNSEGRPFAITQLDLNGSVIQQPEEYIFEMPACYDPLGPQIFPGTARAHIMHYTDGGELVVTGNCFIENDAREQYQSLFRYDIPDAADLRSGNLFFGTYSCDLVPIGNQRTITSWWAPENSVIMDGNLYIVGAFNFNNNTDYGYNFINVNGFNINDPYCYIRGNVAINDLHTQEIEEPGYLTQTRAFEFGYIIYSWIPDPNQECPPPGDGKSAAGTVENDMTGYILKYTGIDEGGIHAILNAETQSNYQIIVYDITGKKVYSAGYDVKGQKYVYLKFNTGNQLYLITVNNGLKFETLKVSGVR